MWPLLGREIRAAIGGEGGEAADAESFTGIAVRDGWTVGDVLIALDLNGLDGHAHVDAYLRGGGLAIVTSRAGERCVRVADTFEAFKRLAAFMRSRVTCPVVAVAGANGKTTTKDMIAAVLRGGDRLVTATRGTENGHYGVPLTLLDRTLSRDAPPSALVIEIGIDAIGAMRNHAALARPDFAVITSLGEEHLRGLIDAETASREELEVLSTGAHRIDEGAPIIGDFDGNKRTVTIGEIALDVALPSAVHARLAALAANVGVTLGRSAREIEAGFRAFRASPGRAEIVALGRDVVLVDDAFNASPASMRVALELAHEPAWAHRPRAVLLGDMLDLGNATARCHAALVPVLADLRGAHLRLFGDAMAAVHAELSSTPHELGSLIHVPSRADPLDLLDGVWGALEGALVIVKGSRGMRLERVTSALRRAYTSPRPLPPRPSFGEEFLTVGVTGTNGKSTTTTWIAQMLAKKFGAVARATTLGYFLGEERLDHALDFDGFVAALGEAHARGARTAALEVTSESLHHGFAKIWPFRIAVFTNLTHDHLDVHTTPEHYLASKAQLFMHLPPGGVAVLNACDPASTLLREVLPAGVKWLQYGVGSRGAPAPDVDLFVRDTTSPILLERSAALSAFPREITLPFTSDVFVENALAAALGAFAAGVPVDAIVRSLATLALPAGRFEMVSDKPRVVIDYAHTPDALTRTIAAARTMVSRSPRGSARVILVFGAGGDRDTRKRAPMGRAAAEADVVIVTNDNPRTEDPMSIARDLTSAIGKHASVTIELDRARAIEVAITMAHDDDVVLVCGKGHETHQTIGRERLPFSDRDVALQAMTQRKPQRMY